MFDYVPNMHLIVEYYHPLFSTLVGCLAAFKTSQEIYNDLQCPGFFKKMPWIRVIKNVQECF